MHFGQRDAACVWGLKLWLMNYHMMWLWSQCITLLNDLFSYMRRLVLKNSIWWTYFVSHPLISEGFTGRMMQRKVTQLVKFGTWNMGTNKYFWSISERPGYECSFAFCVCVCLCVWVFTMFVYLCGDFSLFTMLVGTNGPFRDKIPVPMNLKVFLRLKVWV